MRRFLFYVAVLLAVQIAHGQTGQQGKGEFSCYQCDNLTSKTCGHGKDVDREHIKPCKNGTDPNVDMYLPPGKTFHLCRKIVSVIDFDVNTNKATERIKRTCGYEDSIYDDQCYYRAGLGGRVTVCTCKDGECNHGTNIMPNTLGLCLTIAAVVGVVAKSLNFS